MRDTLRNLVQRLAFAVFVRPAMLIFAGFTAKHIERLPRQGPAIVIANHNSHLDILFMMAMYPAHMLPKLRPVAAARYFFNSRALRFLSWLFLDALPMAPKDADANPDPLAGCRAALAQGDIVMLFPEGTRGDPEVRTPLKFGIAKLAEEFPEVPIVPVFIKGAGKVLPRDELVPVPFLCSAAVGHPLARTQDRRGFLLRIEYAFAALARELPAPAWR